MLLSEFINFCNCEYFRRLRNIVKWQSAYMEGSGHDALNGNAVTTNEQYLLEQIRRHTVFVNDALAVINSMESEVSKVTGQLEQSLRDWDKLFQMYLVESKMFECEAELVDRYFVCVNDLQLELSTVTEERDQLKQKVEELVLRNNVMFNNLHPFSIG